MKVKLNESYWFEVLDNQFIPHFVHEGKDKDGNSKKSDTTLGYYTSIERMVKMITQHAISKKKVTVDVMEFLSMWKEISDEMFSDIRKLNLP